MQAHNCGRADHLLKFWKDTVCIDRSIGVSCLTHKKAQKEVLEDCRANLAIFKD